MKRSSALALACLTLLSSVPAPRAEAAANNTPSAPYDLAQLDAAPKPESQTPPVYPAALRRAKITGEAQIRLVVDASGAVNQAECISSTRPEFAESAMAAVQQWRFTPAVKDGRAVACRLVVPIVFSLN